MNEFCQTLAFIESTFLARQMRSQPVTANEWWPSWMTWLESSLSYVLRPTIALESIHWDIYIRYSNGRYINHKCTYLLQSRSFTFQSRHLFQNEFKTKQNIYPTLKLSHLPEHSWHPWELSGSLVEPSNSIESVKGLKQPVPIQTPRYVQVIQEDSGYSAHLASTCTHSVGHSPSISNSPSPKTVFQFFVPPGHPSKPSFLKSPSDFFTLPLTPLFPTFIMVNLFSSFFLTNYCLSFLTSFSQARTSHSQPRRQTPTLSQAPRGSQCAVTHVRKEWRSLTQSEQAEFIGALKCLGSRPSKLLGAGYRRYDDLQYVHCEKKDDVHFSAYFLPCQSFNNCLIAWSFNLEQYKQRLFHLRLQTSVT